MENLAENNLDQSSQILKKSVSAIHISAPLTALQRKLNNVLLLNAYDELIAENTHSISYSLLCYMLGYNSKNLDYLKLSIQGLQSTLAEFDLMEDGKSQVWESVAFLSYVSIKEGVVYYRYDPALKEKLYHPDIYAKLNLSVLQKVQSTYSLALYENCFRYLKVGKTPEWTLDIFRRLMGVSHLKSYQQFKELKRVVISPAMKEVNSLTNISLKLLTIKEGRKIISIRFEVKTNAQTALFDLREKTKEAEKIEKTDEYKKLIELGAKKEVAIKWMLEFGNEYIAEKIHIMDSQGKVENPVGFLSQALKNDYKKSPPKKSNISQKHEEKIKIENIKSEIDRLESLIVSIKKERNKESVNIINKAFNGFSNEVQKNIIDAFTSNQESLFDFNKNKWDSLALRANIVEFWEKEHSLKFPSFDDISKKRDIQTIEKIQEQISYLDSKIAR